MLAAVQIVFGLQLTSAQVDHSLQLAADYLPDKLRSIEMLHEKPVRCGPLGEDVDGTSIAPKRRRQSSSSDAPTATAQVHNAPISYANDHQAPITDMAIVQAQDNALESGEEEETNELFGPEVILSEEDQAGFAKLLPPDNPPRMSMTQMSWEDNYEQLERHGRLRIAYYKPESGRCRELKDPDAYSEDDIRKQDYYKYLEEEDCFEWFFHTDDSWNPDLDYYQRIVLRNFVSSLSISVVESSG